MVLSGHTQYSATKKWLDIYTGSDNTPYKLNSTPADPIYILENNQVTVSQYVKSYNITADSDQATLSFYAYLVETVSNNSQTTPKKGGLTYEETE